MKELCTVEGCEKEQAEDPMYELCAFHLEIKLEKIKEMIREHVREALAEEKPEPGVELFQLREM